MATLVMVLPRMNEATKEPNGFALKTKPVIPSEKPFSSASGGKKGAMIETLITENRLARTSSPKRRCIQWERWGGEADFGVGGW